MKTRIKETRLDLNMTQETLGEKANVSSKQIYRIENEEQIPRTDTLVNIAEALETTVSYLIYESETKDRINIGSIETVK